MYLFITNDKLKICARAPEVISRGIFKILLGIFSKPQELTSLLQKHLNLLQGIFCTKQFGKVVLWITPK